MLFGPFYLNGGGGIRTHGALADTLVFKTRALNHSTTPPGLFGFIESKLQHNKLVTVYKFKDLKIRSRS